MRALLIMFIAVSAAAAELSVTQIEDTSVTMLIDDQPVATYVYNDPDIPRPYIKDVHTRSGIRVTRPYPTDPVTNKDNDDHPTYHPGIWLAFGDIDGADFWRNKARVRTEGFDRNPTVVKDTIGFSVNNVYENDGEKICDELFAVELHLDESGGYYLFCVSKVTPANETMAYGDQEEMGFGVRIDTPYTVKFGDGRIENSGGGLNEKGTWGKAADWCALIGKKDDRELGINIMPWPDNFRQSWFHARDYGLLVANPFGQKAMTGPRDDDVPKDSTIVKKEEPLVTIFTAHVFETKPGETYDGQEAYDKFHE